MQKETSLSKITRPTLKGAYQRENFFNLLDTCREKPIIWVTAPPGAGKTTLISSYIDARKLKCLWYQIDKGDTDPAAFFHYMGIAAAKANARYQTPLPHLTPEYLLGLQKFSSDYFQDVYKRLKGKSLIVFDNYQEAPAESALHDIIHHGLDSIPEGVTVVIISRSAPPPILSRMRLNQLMEVITYDELRLTADEVVGIAHTKGVGETSDDQVRELLSKTDGWAAGLVLMLEEGVNVSISDEYTDNALPGTVFDYFAGERFKVLDEETQGSLTRLSILPVMSLEMAEAMTGNKKVGSLLVDLVGRNYFIQTHQGDHKYYEFHPLFREFLYNRLTDELSADEVADLEGKAAGLLLSKGYVDDAITLFCKARDWESVGLLICKEAPQLLGQGRHRTITNWLSRIPEEVMSRVPWLFLWKAYATLPFDQVQSRRSFEEAYEVFKDTDDPSGSGTLLSISGVIESIVHGFDDCKPLDSWTKLLGDYISRHPEFPSEEIGTRVTLSMFLALSYRAPHHPDMGLWVLKTMDLLDTKEYTHIHVEACLFLVDYFLWIGDMKRADIIIERLSRAIGSNKLPPYATICQKLAEALSHWFHGRLDECIATVKEGLALADSTGVKVFNYFLYGHGAVASLTRGDLKGAKKYLDEASSVLDDSKRFCASYYHHVRACYDLLLMNHSGALEHETVSNDLAVELGTPFADAMSRTGLAFIKYELGNRDEAAREIKKAHDLAVSTKSELIEFVCFLFEAHFALGAGDRPVAVERLRSAMVLGNTKGFMNFHMWREDIVSSLLLLALEEGLEVDYVKRIISKRHIFPEMAPLEVDGWPWPIRIYLLGQFAIVKDGARLEFGKKVPKKPIELLNLLIALGGKDVAEEKISDTLWPDADGDAAHVTFTTTLKRLRSLMGVENAIVLKNGSLTLNPRYCWVDTWLFNDLVDRALVSSDEIDKRAAGLLEKAMEVYGSGVSAKPNDEPWAFLFNERIRSRFIRAVVALGSYWEGREMFEQAVFCYTKGVEAEMLSEELYQKLMLCLSKLGQKEEAVVMYHRLSSLSKKILGVGPSSKTERILSRINST